MADVIEGAKENVPSENVQEESGGTAVGTMRENAQYMAAKAKNQLCFCEHLLFLALISSNILVQHFIVKRTMNLLLIRQYVVYSLN